MANEHIICRVCLEIQNSVEDYKFLDDEYEGGDVIIRDMLHLCIPEIDSYVSNNPIICLPCLKLLAENYNFKNKCLTTENRIRNYLIRNNLLDYNRLNLNCLLQSNAPTTLYILNGDVPNNPNSILIKPTQNVASNEMQSPNLGHLNVGINEAQLNAGINEIQLNGISSPEQQAVENNMVNLTSNANLSPVQNNKKLKSILTAPRKTKNTQESSDSAMVICKYCPFSTISNKLLQRHICSYRPVFSCKLCSFTTPEKSMFRMHISRFHKKFNWFYCPDCEFSTSDAESMRIHKLETHNQELLKTLQCQKCSYVALNDFLLKKHMWKHDNPKILKCEQCSYETTDKSNFKKHTFTHNNKKPVKCNLCSYSSASPYQMRRHVKRLHKLEDSTNMFTEMEVKEEPLWVGHSTD